MSEGLTIGIDAGRSEVANASVALAKQAMSSVQNELDIHSPSKAFMAFGNYIGEGLALGIRQSADQAVSATEGMMEKLKGVANSSYDDIEDWVSNAKYFDELTLEEEMYLWELVVSKYEEGTEEWLKANKNAYTAYKALLDDKYQDSMDWIEREKNYNRLSQEEELAAYERMQNQYVLGTKEREEVDLKYYQLKHKMIDEDVDAVDAEIARQYELLATLDETSEAYRNAQKEIEYLENTVRPSAAYKNAEKWIGFMDDFDLWSGDDEKLVSLGRELGYTEKGSDEWLDTTKKMYDLSKEMAEKNVPYAQAALAKARDHLSECVEGTIEWDYAMRNVANANKNLLTALNADSEKWMELRDTFGRQRGLTEKLAESLRVLDRNMQMNASPEDIEEFQKNVYSAMKDIYDKYNDWQQDIQDAQEEANEKTLTWSKDATDNLRGAYIRLSLGSTYFQIHGNGDELNISSDDMELQYSSGAKAVKISPSYLLLHSPSNEDSKIEITDEKVALSGNVILDNLEWIGITGGDARFIHSKSLPHHILGLRDADKDIIGTIGSLSNLTTINKSNLVAAINSEVLARKEADEEIEKKFNGTMPEPITVEHLDNTWRPGFYKSFISELKPDFGDVSREWTVAVTNSSYTEDGGDEYFVITQAAIGNDGNIKAYRAVEARCDDASQVLELNSFGDWKLVEITTTDVDGLDQILLDIENEIGKKADFKNSSNGFNAGNNSSATDGGVAIGNYASTTSGGAIGSEAESKNGFAGGYHAKATGMGAAVGANAHAYHGGAVGSGAQAGNGFAGGLNAKCGTAPNGADIDCIQLGEGTNGSEKTLKVYDYQLLDQNGYIPAERMKKGSYSNPYFLESADECTLTVGWHKINRFNIDYEYSGETEFNHENYYDVFMFVEVSNVEPDGEPVEMTQYVFLENTILTRSIRDDGGNFYWSTEGNDPFHDMKGIDNPLGTLQNPKIVTEEELSRTWQPGWYKCTFRPVSKSGEPILATADYGFPFEYVVEVVTTVSPLGPKYITHIITNQYGEHFSRYLRYVPVPLGTVVTFETMMERVGPFKNEWEKANDTSNNSYSIATVKSEILTTDSNFIDETTGKYSVTFVVPEITINDNVFGEFEVSSQQITFSGQAPRTGYGSPYNEYYYAKYSFVDTFSEGKSKLSFNECVGVTKTSGQPVSYIELKNGNILSAVYIYLGCSELSGELLGPSDEEMPFKGTYWWNQDTQIPLLHYSSVQDEIEKLKQSFVASINSIGGGLKITDGVLSIDCASVSDTENAVNEIIK